MLMVQSNLDVPKLTIMTNGSFGAGNYAKWGIESIRSTSNYP